MDKNCPTYMNKSSLKPNNDNRESSMNEKLFFHSTWA